MNSAGEIAVVVFWAWFCGWAVTTGLALLKLRLHGDINAGFVATTGVLAWPVLLPVTLYLLSRRQRIPDDRWDGALEWGFVTTALGLLVFALGVWTVTPGGSRAAVCMVVAGVLSFLYASSWKARS